MNGIGIYEDMDRFDEMFGDLDFTLLHSGEKHEVFVYGTLMKGMRNHHRLESDGVKLIDDYALTGDPPMRMSTRMTQSGYPAPIVTEVPYDEDFMPGDPSFVEQIWGELYEVSNSVLIYLDRLEGHPEVYCRKRTRVCYTTPTTPIYTHPWMYLYAGEPTDNSDYISRVENGFGVISYKWKGEE